MSSWMLAAVMAARVPHPAPADVPDEPVPVEDIGASSDEEDSDTVREVVVHRDADQLSATAKTIGRREIDSMPKRSAADLLRHVPGMHIVQHGGQGKGYQFYLRGFDAVHGADIETQLNDVPINEASNVHAHGYLDLAFIIPEAVDTVDATKGSYRLEQGNFGTAGSIRYRLGVPQRGTRATYEFGSTLRHRLSLVHAPKRRDKETFLALEAMDDQGYGQRRHAQRLSGIGQAKLYEGRGTTVTVMGAMYGARFELPGTVRLDDVRRGDVGLYDSYTDDSVGESSRAVGSVTVKTDRGRVRSRTSAWVQARRFMLDENFTGDLLFEDVGDRHRQLHAALSPGISTELGIRVHPRVEIPVFARWQVDIAEQSTDQLTAEGMTWDTPRELSFSQHALGLGTGIRATPTDWMQLEAGGRVDVFATQVRDAVQQRDFSGASAAVSPRVMTKFLPFERWQLFAAYGRGVRSPEARAYTLPETAPADEDLSRYAGGRARVTKSDSVEVGTRVRPSILDIGVAGFGTWIDRESVFDHVSGFNVERSATQRLGVEGDVQLHPTAWMDIGADVTWARGRFLSSGAPIPGAPPLIVTAKASIAHPKGFRAGVRWFALGARPLSYGAIAAPTTVMDLNVGYRYRWAQLDLSIDNLWNQGWREGEYHFASHWDPNRARSQLPTVHAVAGNPFMARVALTLHFDAMGRRGGE
ncbi:MAG: TonB-dependent receptor [Myxococcota bacterium]